MATVLLLFSGCYQDWVWSPEPTPRAEDRPGIANCAFLSHGVVEPEETEGADPGPVRDLLQQPWTMDLRTEEAELPWDVTLQLALDPAEVEIEDIEFVPRDDSEPACGLGRYFGATFPTQVDSSDFTAIGTTTVTWRTGDTGALEVFVRGEHDMTPSALLRDEVHAEAEEGGCDPSEWATEPDGGFYLGVGDGWGYGQPSTAFPGGHVVAGFNGCTHYTFTFGSWTSERGY